MQPEELAREVHRLYWHSDAPVTRLAAQLGVSRGTFYNHLGPLRAQGDCSSCGGALEFHTRSERDAGNARCADCGNEESATASRADTLHALRGLPGGATDTREAALLSARAEFLDTPFQQEDRRRTQLLVVAVGAAALGLGLLFYSRRRK